MISLEFDNELMRNKPNRKILPLFTLSQALTFLSDNETQVPIQLSPLYQDEKQIGYSMDLKQFFKTNHIQHKGKLCFQTSDFKINPNRLYLLVSLSYMKYKKQEMVMLDIFDSNGFTTRFELNCSNMSSNC